MSGYKELVDPTKAKEILKPYWTQFVHESHIMRQEGQIVLQSQLGVDKPWYCDATGHMNAVELTLSFNQMMYLTIYQCIQLGWIPELLDFNREYFMQKYWPDFLISKVESQFKAPIDVRQFCGTLRIKSITPSSKHLWFDMDVSMKPGNQDFPIPGDLTHAYSSMNLVIKDYKNLPILT